MCTPAATPVKLQAAQRSTGADAPTEEMHTFHPSFESAIYSRRSRCANNPAKCVHQSPNPQVSPCLTSDYGFRKHPAGGSFPKVGPSSDETPVRWRSRPPGRGSLPLAWRCRRVRGAGDSGWRPFGDGRPARDPLGRSACSPQAQAPAGWSFKSWATVRARVARGRPGRAPRSRGLRGLPT